MARRRNEQTLDEQVENVFNDKYLRAVSIRMIQTAETIWRKKNPDQMKAPVGLEIGGAGGITKRLRPEWTVTDIRNAIGVDVVVDAQKLPFDNQKFDLIYAIDVIHHIENLEHLLREVHRVLKPGGVFFVREPYWGPVAQIVWRTFHPEDFSVKKLFQTSLEKDPMSGNQALAQAILKKKSKCPDGLIPKELEVIRIGEMTGFAFLLSGGATFRTKFPRGALIKLEKWELKHRLWLKIFGFSTAFFFAERNQ